MIAFALGADIPYFGTWGRMNFFLFVTITSWIFVIAVFVLFALNIISMINVNIDWNIPVSLLIYTAPSIYVYTLIYQRRKNMFWPNFQTPRRQFKILRVALYFWLYNDQINSRALIGQSISYGLLYCASELMEKLRVFWIII